MTPPNATLDAEIMVSAVISRTEIPAFVVAALEPGDVLETEPEIGGQTIVRLTIGTTTIAFASIAKVEGRLIATIIDIKRPDLSGPKDDSWKVRKPNRPTD
jgi:flagellar motor switch/type III secretory pathway protein FliN